ncbi:MAG: hypothetical protein KDK70_34720 [Myxococcales bacterium]|nr:hypothetical protein [Myxococcales bacterium]
MVSARVERSRVLAWVVAGGLLGGCPGKAPGGGESDDGSSSAGDAATAQGPGSDTGGSPMTTTPASTSGCRPGVTW